MYLNRSREVFLKVKDNFIVNFWVVRSFKLESMLVWCTFPRKCCTVMEHKEQVHTMLQCMMNVRLGSQNHPDLAGEKLVSLQWHRSQSLFIWVSEVWWKPQHPSSLHPKMPTRGNSIDLMGFTQFLLKREVGTTDFQRKADSAWWASGQSWNTNTCASGTGEWAGTPSPARTIAKVLLELKPGFACVAAHLGWHPARAVLPVLSPAQAAAFGFHLLAFGNSHWSLCRIKCMKRRGKTCGVINIYINWFYLISSFPCPCRANAWNASRSLTAATQPALGDHDVLSSPVLSLLKNSRLSNQKNTVLVKLSLITCNICCLKW